MNNRRKFLIFAILTLIVTAIAGCDSTKTTSSKNSPGSTPKGSTNAAEVYSKAAPGAVPPHSLGAPNAAVTLEEFADFQCPTCAGIHPRVQELRAAYGDRLRIIFRQYPLRIPQHDKAYEAAVAAEAAGMQGKFWDMQNLLFTNQRTWSVSQTYRKTFEDYAQKLGLDVQKFTDDMAGLMTKNRVDSDMQRGDSLGINSTPTIYINGKSVQLDDMTVEGMRKIIDEELQKSQNKTPPVAANNNTNATILNAPANAGKPAENKPANNDESVVKKPETEKK